MTLINTWFLLTATIVLILSQQAACKETEATQSVPKRKRRRKIKKSSGSKGSKKKPNIVLLFADDVGTGDVPGYHKRSSLVEMPNLEQLLTEGTTFSDAHSTPLCAPSRYVLLSGNYQHRGVKFGGSWTLNYEGNQFRNGQRSIASVFSANGYKTAMFGKWHLGGRSLLPFHVYTFSNLWERDDHI